MGSKMRIITASQVGHQKSIPLMMRNTNPRHQRRRIQNLLAPLKREISQIRFMA